jgi:hypothetical protein
MNSLTPAMVRALAMLIQAIADLIKIIWPEGLGQ